MCVLSVCNVLTLAFFTAKKFNPDGKQVVTDVFKNVDFLPVFRVTVMFSLLTNWVGKFNYITS